MSESEHCANCLSGDFGDCPRCFHQTGLGCGHGPLCEGCASDAAAGLGRLGGKAGRGEAKRRGDSAYYKALRAKAPKLCRRCRLPQEISYDHDRACTWNPHNRVSLD